VRSRKIEKVVAIARAEERRTGSEAGASRQRLDDARQKLGELNAWRSDYVSRGDGIGSITSSHWKDYQGFLARLDAALSAQQQVVRDCEQQLDTLRRRWMVKRQRLDSLERVLQRYRDEERLDAERREQRQADDRAPSGPPFGEDGGG